MFFRIFLIKLEKQSFATASKRRPLLPPRFPSFLPCVTNISHFTGGESGWKAAWLWAPHGAGGENHWDQLLLKVSPTFHSSSFRRQTALVQVDIILCKIKQAPLGKGFCYLDAVRKFSLFFFFFFLVQVLKINHFNLSSLVNMQL